MGNFSDAMQRLVEDIGSSAESRHVNISEMVSNSRNLLERFRLERQDMASILNDKLSSDNTANKEATQQYLNSVKADLQNMASTLNDKLSSENTANKEATQQYLNSVKADLQNMASTLNEKLSSDNTANKEATQQFINELVSDRGTAQRIWRKSFLGVVEKPVQPIIEVAVEEPVRPVVVKETVVESPAQFVAEVAVEEPVQPVIEEEAEPFPEKQILEVIAGHPGGIKLVDIGNELGVDWRSLIGIIKPLVDGGKIDKMENLYYPRS